LATTIFSFKRGNFSKAYCSKAKQSTEDVVNSPCFAFFSYLLLFLCYEKWMSFSDIQTYSMNNYRLRNIYITKNVELWWTMMV